MKNKTGLKKSLFLTWQSQRQPQLVILITLFFFYSLGTLQSYSFFDSPAFFQLSFLFPFSAILLSGYLTHCILTKKHKQTLLLLPVLTLFTTLFVCLNSVWHPQYSTQLYFILLLPLFYAYLLSYNFQILVINNLIVIISYTLAAIILSDNSLFFILNVFLLCVITFLSSFQKNVTNRLKKTNKQTRNSVINDQKRLYLQQVIHDIRQPLSSLSLYSHLLEKQLQDTPQQELLSNLTLSSQQLDRWLSSLFELASLDSKSVPVKIKNIKLQTAIAPLIKKYQYQAKQQGSVLKVNIGNWVINSDVKHLNDILDALLSNALLHGKKSSTDKILISAKKCAGEIKLQVWNQGHKIEQCNISSLFNELSYSKSAKHNKKAGLGLGLAIAARKAKLLDTNITVKSDAHGSCFSICIKEGEKNNISHKINIIEKENNASILLVDDDTSILNALSMLLEGWGYQLVCAKSSEQALSALKKQKFSLIISDFRLPGQKNGIDLINIAEQKGVEAAVLLTGEVDPNKLKKEKDAYYRILHKPIKPAALRVLLRQLLSR